MIKELSEFREGMVLGDDAVHRYHEFFRDHAEIGDGATVCHWTDRSAYTIIARTPKTLTLRRCKTTIDPSFKPEWCVGGFSAVCLNQNDQKWLYEEDETGEVIKAHWSDKYGKFRYQSQTVIPGRHEFYDYNF